MVARPIIFSAPMIRALLDGRKTQTRRVLKVQPETGSYRLAVYDPQGFASFRHDAYTRKWNVKLPYASGDRLWVKERTAWLSSHGWRYMADNQDLSDYIEDGELGKWCSPIHMPRRASRLTLIVTDVRVQRLLDITEADAVSEGCQPHKMGTGRNPFESYRLGFSDLWNSLHGPDAWDANPWVCALTFTVHKCNIDQMGADQ